MPDDDVELIYLTLEDALELYAAIAEGTIEQAAAVLRSRSSLEGALVRPARRALPGRRHRTPGRSARARDRRDGKEGSTVRVRQRASLKCLQNGAEPCLGSKRLSRAGTRGLSLMFPLGASARRIWLVQRDLAASDPLYTAKNHAQPAGGRGCSRHAALMMI
jgi:hypothetical protein